jgi:hypothetical protein
MRASPTIHVGGLFCAFLMLKLSSSLRVADQNSLAKLRAIPWRSGPQVLISLDKLA